MTVLLILYTVLGIVVAVGLSYFAILFLFDKLFPIIK